MNCMEKVEVLEDSLDKELLREIDIASKEINNRDCRVMSYEEIDNL